MRCDRTHESQTDLPGSECARSAGSVPPHYEKAGFGAAYHGYWVQNYCDVNPHFGDWDSVGDLSANLRRRGMRLMLDFTLNHSNPKDDHVFGPLYGPDNSIIVDSYDNDKDETTGKRFYKHYEGNEQCQKARSLYDNEKSDWQLQHCLLANLSGHDQHNRAVVEYLIGAGTVWLQNGVDDFRLDAVKYPYRDFVAEFTHAMIEFAIGKLQRASPPYILGEWSNGGVGDETSLDFANHFPYFRTNILDFQLALRLNRFIGGDKEATGEQLSAEGLGDFLKQRSDAFKDQRDTWQGTFIDNHDQMRTLVRLQKLGIDSPERERRLDLGTVLLMTLAGVPVILYGDEQYLANYDDNNRTLPIKLTR